MHPHEWPLRPRMVRYFLAAMGMFAWLCVIVVVAQGLQIGSSSPLLWGTAFGGVLTGLACWGALCLRLSDSSIASVLNAIRTTLKQDQPARTESASPLLCQGLILSGLLFFALNATWVYHHQDSPEDDDQQAFLNTAREIHDRGGIPGLWSDLWSGRFEESNRHPLLLAIQSVNPTETGGRVVSLAAAGVTFALILILVRQKMGAFTAGLLSVLIGINGAWVYHAPRIVCESLLTGLAGLLWLSLIPERETSDQESPPPLRLTGAAVAGLLTGLVYLTKGTGLFALRRNSSGVRHHGMDRPQPASKLGESDDDIQCCIPDRGIAAAGA